MLQEVHDFLVQGRPEVEFLVVLVASLITGGLLYFLVSLILTPKKHLRQVIRDSALGLGISRSTTLFFATLAYDGIAHGFALPRLLEPGIHTWVVFVRVLCFGWLLSVTYQVMLTLASEGSHDDVGVTGPQEANIQYFLTIASKLFLQL